MWLDRNADAEKALRALVGVPPKVDVPGVVARAAELEREVIELRKRGQLSSAEPQARCVCGNAARYVDQHGALTCGICPLKAGDDSIKINNVLRLLEWARLYLRAVERGAAQDLAHMTGDLRDIIQRGPT